MIKQTILNWKCIGYDVSSFFVRKLFYLGEGFSRHTLSFFLFIPFYSGASLDMYTLFLFLGIKCEQSLRKTIVALKMSLSNPSFLLKACY